MANVQWTQIREKTGQLLFSGNRMLDAHESEIKAKTRLDDKMNEKKKAMDTVEKKLKMYKKKLGKTTIDEKIEKYQFKITKWQMESDRLNHEAEDAKQQFERAKLKRSDWENDRKMLKGEIEKLLKSFTTEKWVTIMGIEDATAISIFNDIAKEGKKKLNFMIGSSVREGTAHSIDWAMDKIELVKNLESKKVYELSQAGLKMLSDEEKSSLEGQALAAEKGK